MFKKDNRHEFLKNGSQATRGQGNASRLENIAKIEDFAVGWLGDYFAFL